MKICAATTVLSIALLLGNSVKLTLTTDPDSGDSAGSLSGNASQACCQATNGAHGIPGIPGLAGPTGPSGLTGPKGDTGAAGPKGDTGPVGPSGAHGDPGNPGPRGGDGVGLPGLDGPMGPPGSDGAAGQDGAKGDKGDKGDTPDFSIPQVAFTVVRTTHSDESTSHNYRLPFDSAKTLLPGTSFNLASGTFTCTVAGTYVFTYSVLEYGISSTIYVYLRQNGNVIVTGHSGDMTSQEQVSGSAVLCLQLGDIVYLTMHGRSSSSSNCFTSFSGFLIYPE